MVEKWVEDHRIALGLNGANAPPAKVKSFFPDPQRFHRKSSRADGAEVFGDLWLALIAWVILKRGWNLPSNKMQVSSRASVLATQRVPTSSDMGLYCRLCTMPWSQIGLSRSSVL